MTPGGAAWTVRLSTAAEQDFQEILRWTSRRFGQRQARAYARISSAAIGALAAGPAIAGAKVRDDLFPGCRTLHVARGARKGRHILLFRIAPAPNGRMIDVLRLLHDSMDMAQHLQGQGES